MCNETGRWFTMTDKDGGEVDIHASDSLEAVRYAISKFTPYGNDWDGKLTIHEEMTVDVNDLSASPVYWVVRSVRLNKTILTIRPV